MENRRRNVDESASSRTEGNLSRKGSKVSKCVPEDSAASSSFALKSTKEKLIQTSAGGLLKDYDEKMKTPSPPKGCSTPNYSLSFLSPSSDMEATLSESDKRMYAIDEEETARSLVYNRKGKKGKIDKW
ncbi:hypothetical protein NPIL_148341 [Nephila pilipes]|uniref:Uncharacterized protein n=1 Tax=Nephila pilipes TaxID=299642 RepID=A0A8X6QX00_NEPPI|nr:hypothetical protein NPIL_148341 [Nephila pilipes]